MILTRDEVEKRLAESNPATYYAIMCQDWLTMHSQLSASEARVKALEKVAEAARDTFIKPEGRDAVEVLHDIRVKRDALEAALSVLPTPSSDKEPH